MPVPRAVVLFLAIGLVAASQSGNIIRLAHADPLAIAAWRLVIASLLMAPLAGRRLGALGRLRGREVALLVLAGLVLCAHFVTWIAAVQRTTVANAAVFFSVNPVFTATAGYLIYRERVSAGLVLSILLGLAGVAVIGLGDLRLSPEDALGDGLAIVCSLLFTAYFLLGKRLRQVLDNRVYVTVLYGVAAAAGFGAIAALPVPVASYDAQTWMAFLLMALVPTMLGHTSLNHALRYIDAGRISALTLSEPLLAGLVAFAAWKEPIRAPTVAGYVLICASVLVLLRDRSPAPRG